MSESVRTNADTVGSNDGPLVGWTDLRTALLVMPVALLLGLHVALLGYCLRRWLRIPYLLAMIGLYALLLVPLWTWRSDLGFWACLWGTVATMSALVLPICLLGGREIAMDGSNLEMSLLAHLVLISTYLVASAMADIRDRFEDLVTEVLRSGFV